LFAIARQLAGALGRESLVKSESGVEALPGVVLRAWLNGLLPSREACERPS
jgi:hypothetical protein